MMHKRKTVHLNRPGQASKAFLQPLTVALVSLVLVSLALITGLMDLRSLDKTLMGYMEKRGLDIIKNVQQAAKYNYQLLTYASSSDLEGNAVSGLTEGTFSLRETMVLDLLHLAQELDFEIKRNHLDDQALTLMALREGLWIVVLLDAQGVITFKNRSVPESVLASAGPVIKGDEGIKVNLFDRSGKGDQLRSFAVRRKWGGGTLVFVLNRADFLFWKGRVSLERAVEEAGLGTDTAYFEVTDKEGRILFQTQETGTPAHAPGHQKMLEVVTPLRLDGAVAFTARLRLSRESADQMLEKEKQRAFVFTGFMVFIAILSIWFLYRNQARHLANMREMERRLYRAERLSAMGRLAAGVAHEIRNPLNAISMACQRLQKDNLDQLTGIIRDEIRRLNRIVEEFIGFSRSGKPVMKAHDITALLKQISLLVAEEAASQGITLQTDWRESPLIIWMDADKIKQALFNIIKNAIESISDQGAVTLSVEPEGKKWVKISIVDTGSGLTREEMEQIFDPDYTTKEKGLGLGLALAHEIIQGHGGEIRVMSEPGRGATFEILLPVAPEGQVVRGT